MLRIAIDAQLNQWHRGGGTSVLMGLIRALGRLTDSDEQYVLIAAPNNAELLQEYTGSNQTVVVRKSMRRSDLTTRQQVRRLRIWSGRMFAPPVWPEVPLSDGFYESLGCGLIHFAHPYYEVCSVPTIFQLYDLQHLHYPEYFIPEEIAVRENRFPTACHLAQAVVTGSQWSKRDIHEKYHTPLNKIYAIWNGPPTETYSGDPTPADVLRGKYDLPQAFMLYPAAVMPHKNHLRLLEAIAHLRDAHDLPVNLVCTGNDQWPHFQTVRQHVMALNLDAQVRLLGVVPQEDLRGLYAMCRMVVFPSEFEGAGYPPLEAFHAGTAVACSNATSLPEAVGDAALTFDPRLVDAIAEAIRTLWLDEKLRSELVAKGTERLAQFSWDRTARTYRALYRYVARQTLNSDDQSLLDQLLA